MRFFRFQNFINLKHIYFILLLCHCVKSQGILEWLFSNLLPDLEASTPKMPKFEFKGCGVAVGKQTAQRRIVGGDDAGFGTFPWQAYIRIGSSRCNMLMSIFELIGWKQCWIER